MTPTAPQSEGVGVRGAGSGEGHSPLQLVVILWDPRLLEVDLHKAVHEGRVRVVVAKGLAIRSGGVEALVWARTNPRHVGVGILHRLGQLECSPNRIGTASLMGLDRCLRLLRRSAVVLMERG